MEPDSTNEKGLLMNAYYRYNFGERNFSENEWLQVVKRNGYAIRHIKNPSEKIQLTAVKETGYAIRWIKNPSKEVQLEAVKQFGYAIRYIRAPSFKFLKEKLKGTNLEKLIDKEIMKSACK